MELQIDKTVLHKLVSKDKDSALKVIRSISSVGITSIGDGMLVRDVEYKVLELGKDNVFDKDILTMLQTPKADITFLSISCYTSSDDGEADTPIRFTLEINDAVPFALLSEFTMANIETFSLTKVTVKGITLTDEDVANLVIVVGSKNKNE